MDGIIAAAGSLPAVPTMDSLQQMTSGVFSQVAALTSKLSDVNMFIQSAQTQILADCTAEVTDGLAGAVQKATDAATVAANAAVASNPIIIELTNRPIGVPDPTFSSDPGPTFTGEPVSGGGRQRCKCRCNCNIKTRSKKKSKRSKTRARR